MFQSYFYFRKILALLSWLEDLLIHSTKRLHWFRWGVGDVFTWNHFFVYEIKYSPKTIHGCLFSLIFCFRFYLVDLPVALKLPLITASTKNRSILCNLRGWEILKLRMLAKSWCNSTYSLTTCILRAHRTFHVLRSIFYRWSLFRRRWFAFLFSWSCSSQRIEEKYICYECKYYDC